MKPSAAWEESFVSTLIELVPGCLAIYRFGTFGTKAQRHDSDIDIAILPPKPLGSLIR
jgi:predicted nucleotidyltransferase